MTASTASQSRPELTTSTERISAELAAARVADRPARRAPLTVDVRAPREREQKRIGGSVGHAAQSSWRAPVGAADRSPAPRATAPAAIARRLPPASCCAMASRRSARLPAASPHGKRRSCRCRPAPRPCRPAGGRAGRLREQTPVRTIVASRMSRLLLPCSRSPVSARPCYLMTSVGTIGLPSHNHSLFGPRVSARDVLPGTAGRSTSGSHFVSS